MKIFRTKALLVSVATLLLMFVSLHIKADDRNEKANQIRKEVWSWETPYFSNYVIPDSLKNESVVIIARRTNIEATSQGKFKILYQNTGMHRDMEYVRIDRVMVKLNDQDAIKKFADFSFRDQIKDVDYKGTNKMNTVMGARIIKPSGEIVEVDIDKEALEVTEGKNNKVSYKKLSIPGLQTGDILDYFFCYTMQMQTVNPPEINFLFYGQYPTLSASLHCCFGQKLTVEYRCMNGAPNMQESNDSDNNTILEASASNLKAYKNLEKLKWTSPSRDLPIIRMFVYNSGSANTSKLASARPYGVFGNLKFYDILNDAKVAMALQKQTMFWVNDTKKDVEKAIANYKAVKIDYTKQELAACIYDAMRIYWSSNNNDYMKNKFTFLFHELLKENGIDCKFIFTTSKYGYKRTDVLSYEDLPVGVTANSDSQFFFYPNILRNAVEIPTRYQGEIATTVDPLKFVPNDRDGIIGNVADLKIPMSGWKDNNTYTLMNVSFNSDNEQQLSISRKVTLSGDHKTDFIDAVYCFEDWDSAVRENILMGKKYVDEMKEDKKRHKELDQYYSVIAEQRKKQKDVFESEIQSSHDIKPLRIDSFKINNWGLSVYRPKFEYSLSYQMEGIVKKTGETLIVNIQKLCSPQWQPDADEKKRTINAHLPVPYSVEDDITIKYPAGYMPKNTDLKELKFANEYGSFESKITYNSDNLHIKTFKKFTKDFVPVEDWGQIVEVADQSVAFGQQYIIFQKQ